MNETNKKRTGQRSTSGKRTASTRTSGSRSSTTSSRSSQSASRRSVERAAAAQNTKKLGAGNGNARRTTSTTRRRKRRRQGPDFAKILLIAIGAVILILCIAVGLKGCSNDESNQKEQIETTTAEPETEIKADITVNGISVAGLTKTEAKEKILSDMGWDIKVEYNGEEKSVENLLSANVEQVLESAFEKGEAGTYTVTMTGIEAQAEKAVADLASVWDVQPKNGSISSYNQATGEFVFSGAQNGKLIDRESLAAELVSAVKSGEYKKTIKATATEKTPEITEAEAKASFKRLGTYTTTTTSNKARNENIRIASEALNGMIIQPGEEFSFNLTTGNRTAEKGYQAAGAYVNGVLVEEPGGGVCQVSSTLYNAVVFAGLKTTERHAHSYEPSYVTPGEDAMVSYDGHSGPDMKFINNSKTAVGIKTSFSNQKLTISVYGNPILEDGVTLSMVSEKVKELDPPAPVYVEDQTLEPGTEVEVKAATSGSRWVTNLVTKKDGVVIEEILLHNSSYNGKSATIKRNTSGIKLPAEGETSAESSSVAESSESGENSSKPVESTAAEITVPTTSAAVPSSPADGSGNTNTAEPESPGSSLPGPADHPSPVSPGDVTGAAVPSGGPGGAETNADPSNMGLISPMNH